MEEGKWSGSDSKSTWLNLSGIGSEVELGLVNMWMGDQQEISEVEVSLDNIFFLKKNPRGVQWEMTCILWPRIL